MLSHNQKVIYARGVMKMLTTKREYKNRLHQKENRELGNSR